MCQNILDFNTSTFMNFWLHAIVLIVKDFVLEHHTFSINLDDNFHNILSNGEKTRVYSTLVSLDDFQDTNTNKKIKVSKYFRF